MSRISDLFGREVPLLGFGCMRLPEGDDGEYVMEECQAMFDFAMANGINYFDSAWHYIDSQKTIGECLKKYPRESYILVGKLCFYDGTLESREQAAEAFEKELRDANTSYMDLELIHSLGNPGSFERVDALDIWGFMRDLKASGRVKHIGISFHSLPQNLDRVLSQHPEIEVVQIQANYFDHEAPGSEHAGASYEVYEVCRKYNKPVIIMEPVKGGSLSNVDRHPEIAELFAAGKEKYSPSAWALRYAASLEGVVTVLSGMSSLKQMKENYATLMENFKPLEDSERQMLKKAAGIIIAKAPVGCTGCRYCVDKGCAAGIDIPEVIAAYNMKKQYHDVRGANLAYFQGTDSLKKSAAACVGCGSCEKACPQHLPIMELMKTIDGEFQLEGVNVWANW